MSRIKRRQFLQFTGSLLATLGLSQLEIQQQSLRYAKAIAQNTPRKLALLVGVNGYENSPLEGCISDVYLQRELLIYRFGFKPQDILLVTDDTPIKPTRAGILQAFEDHLIKQAKPGDVVVYHFSGHGSQVIDSQSITQDGLNSTFVPIDRRLSREGNKKTVSEIMGGTLFLLMSALKTENITAVLDSCHSGGGKRGNLNVRAMRGDGNYPTQQELDYQQRWLSQLKMSPEEYRRQRQQGVAKGVVVASARRDQLAADAPFDGFHAGAFTYVMTQYLWQETGNQGLGSVVADISRNTTKISSTHQVPEYEAKVGSGYENQPAYLVNKQSPAAEAVITKIQGNQVEFWLGGINPQAFAAFNQGAVFSLIDAHGVAQGLVKLESRDGIKGFGTLVEAQSNQTLETGLFLQEQARTIPKDFRLRIGLDESLTSEQTNNIGQLAPIERLEFMPLGISEVHYLLGRMTPEIQRELQQAKTPDIPTVSSIGLYGQGLDLIPNSFGSAGETVAAALTRLKSKLHSLLAARLVKLTLNADSSRLNVLTLMKLKNGELVAKEFTARGGINKTQTQLPEPIVSGIVEKEGNLPKIALGSSVQFEVVNRENRDLYVTVLVIDPEGSLNVIFPNSWTDTVDTTLIITGETRRIPDTNKGDQFSLKIGEPLGTVEVLVIASVTPLQDALKALQSIAQSRGQNRGPIGDLGNDSPQAIDSLLEDFDRGTRGAEQKISLSRGDIDSDTHSIYAQYASNVRAIDTSLLAAMSISFQVVD